MLKLKFAMLALAAAAAVTGATLAATPALAAPAAEAAPTARIPFADLNLANAAGVARLNDRVRRTAEALCLSDGEEVLQRRLEAMACRDRTIAAAAPQVRRAVERFAAARTGAAVTVAVVN